MTTIEKMTLNELGTKLKEMYYNAPKGEKSTMVFLFGIRYHSEIKKNELFKSQAAKAREIVKTAGINSAYATTILKAVKLGKYVIEKP